MTSAISSGSPARSWIVVTLTAAVITRLDASLGRRGGDRVDANAMVPDSAADERVIDVRGPNHEPTPPLGSTLPQSRSLSHHGATGTISSSFCSRPAPDRTGSSDLMAGSATKRKSSVDGCDAAKSGERASASG